MMVFWIALLAIAIITTGGIISIKLVTNTRYNKVRQRCDCHKISEYIN